MDRSQRDPSAEWTSLFHLIGVDLMRECYYDLARNKAVGIDKIDKEKYGENLEENLRDLTLRIRKGKYIPKPARIVEIPKADGTSRPLAISCFEDKIIQSCLKVILEAVYEPLFTNSSHGFRPNRGCQTALIDNNIFLNSNKCGAIIDIDLRSFFNSIPHEKLVELLQMKIKQFDMIKLIIKTMRTPSLNKDGIAVRNEQGVPQGGVASPVLANIYLHYVIDIWFQEIQASGIYGECNLVRYADDGIFFFENEIKANEFMLVLQERLRQYGIELNTDKTTKTPYGKKYAAQCHTAKRKIPIYRFLGFVHYWKRSLNKSTGQYFWRPAVRSCPKRMKKKLVAIAEYIKNHRHHPTIVERTAQVVKGIAGYFCVNDNMPSVLRFSSMVRKSLFKWLNRRSQRGMNWKEFRLFINAKGFPNEFKVKNLFFNMKNC